jgi:hypothetical protein
MNKKEIIKKLETYDILSSDGLYHTFEFCERGTGKPVRGYQPEKRNITALRDNLLFYKVVEVRSGFSGRGLLSSTDIILSSVKQEGFWDIKHLKSESGDYNLNKILNKNL